MTRIFFATTIVLLLCAPQAFAQRQQPLVPGASQNMSPILGGGAGGAGTGSTSPASAFPGTTYSSPSRDEIVLPAEPTGMVPYGSYAQGSGYPSIAAPGTVGVGVPAMPNANTQGAGGTGTRPLVGGGGSQYGHPDYFEPARPAGMEDPETPVTPVQTPVGTQPQPTDSGNGGGTGGLPLGSADTASEPNPDPAGEEDPVEDDEEGSDDESKDGWKTAGLLLLWIAAVGGLLYLLPILIDYRRQHQTLLTEKAELEESLAHANRVMAATTASGHERRDPPPRETPEPARRREEHTY